jgi:hypothetical protein
MLIKIDPVPTMHDRHQVGRNRGENLECDSDLTGTE